MAGMRLTSLVVAAVVSVASPAVAQSTRAPDRSGTDGSTPSPSPSPSPSPPPGVGATYLDHAIVDLQPVDGNLVELLIEDRGRAKAPSPVKIWRIDGDTTRCEVPLTVFLGGSRVARFRVPARPAIVRIVLDPDRAYPDANRGNDTLWVKRD